MLDAGTIDLFLLSVLLCLSVLLSFYVRKSSGFPECFRVVVTLY